MKRLIKEHIGDYTFNPATGEVKITGTDYIALPDICYISNNKSNTSIMEQDSEGVFHEGKGGSIQNVVNGLGEKESIITLDYDTTGMDSADGLSILIEYAGVVSSLARGSMYWEGNDDDMTVSGEGVVDKIEGGDTEFTNLSNFTHQSPNKLTYIGSKPIIANINIALSVYEEGGAFISEIGLMKNGTPIVGCANYFTVYQADEPCSAHAIVDLVKGDYIEAYIKKFTHGSQDIFVSYLGVNIQESTE